MKKTLLILLSIFVTAASLMAGPDGWKSRKRLKEENENLRMRIMAMEAELGSLREEASERELIVAQISGENENKVSAALENYTTQPSTDSLLGQWYLHRVSKHGAREQYNMDSVKFTTDVPDSVLMKRLSDMNSFISLPYNETVKNYMILYSEKMPRKMGEMLGLSQYYMPLFEETFIRYGLPVELKYVAIIESMLNPRAESHVGAKGIWQFMYRTGLSYGLRIDSYVDERMDPIASADAAARYFKDAYRIFGDWALAISAYNCGSGNVNKAIKRAGGKRDFWSIYDYLPRETRGYVPAMVGAMYAMNYAKDYDIRPEPISLPVYVDTFHINRNLHFSQVSEILGIPIDDIRDLNPQYHKDIVPGDGSSLRLPFDYTSSFLDLQDSIYRHKADVLSAAKVEDGREVVNGRPVQTAQGTQWIYYKVKSGDNLGKIAKKYHTSVKQLKAWNHLKGDMINIGQRLKVGKR